jgi:hypothetical protein
MPGKRSEKLKDKPDIGGKSGSNSVYEGVKPV